MLFFLKLNLGYDMFGVKNIKGNKIETVALKRICEVSKSSGKCISVLLILPYNFGLGRSALLTWP